jgi:hypothetical protein
MRHDAAAVPSALVVVQSLQGDTHLEGKTDKRGHFAVAHPKGASATSGQNADL